MVVDFGELIFSFLMFVFKEFGMLCIKVTVNSEIFPRVYFHETSHKQSFVKLKSSLNGEIILSFTDIGKSCPERAF